MSFHSTRRHLVVGRSAIWSGLAACCLASSVVTAAQAPARPAANLTKGCIDSFDAARDYFPDKVTIDDAVTFQVEYRKSFKVISIKEAYPGGPSEKYVLVQCGAPAPKLEGDLAGAQVVPVPVASLFAASTTQLPPLVDLGRLEVLTGVSRLKDLIGKEILDRARTGLVREFAAANVIDPELVVSSRPSLLVTGGTFNAALAAIRNAGVPVVADTEWRETTGLGRAEWLKYMALFLNEERQAQNLHAAMKGRYRALSAKATALPETSRPLVMTGRSTRGTFVIAGGRSYVAAFIKDAGGRYAWADDVASGSTSVDLEAQVQRAANADVWINGGGWRSLAAMLEDEPRYNAFKAYRSGQVWVYERGMSETGLTDYWTRSITHPEIVLADLIKIFHPALMSDHAFEWYMQVPAR